MSRLWNFNPGPSVLPLPVVERAREDLLSYRGTGIGVAELSHRGGAFEEIGASAKLRFRELLGLPPEYDVLFVTGGATNQFSMVPMNLLPKGKTADFLVTGFWAERAIDEASKFGAVHEACSGKKTEFTEIPKRYEFSADPAYIHFTSNNTIHGSQFRGEPEVTGTAKSAPLVCDASSDILSRPIEIQRYGLIYAGAQKNLGVAGVTVVIIRKDLLERSPKGLPILMDYNCYAKSDSLYNTPPTFPVYILREVLEWIVSLGGLAEMARRNEEKANLLYGALDANPFYVTTIADKDRSHMNVTFRLRDTSLEEKFLKEAEAEGMVGLKGHRVTGGIRASIYNAFPLEGVKALVEFLKQFAEKNGA